MFTCCPNCETVFKVSAKHLQQAAGRVRCGQCDFSFNALSNLQESASQAVANRPVPADQGGDAGAPPEETAQIEATRRVEPDNDEQTAAPDEVVLVEDVEAFEAAVLATIHATESKAWESSGPHFVGNLDDADTPPGESTAGDDERTDDEPDADASTEDAPAADEDDAWLASEAQDTDPEGDVDQPSMDFLERMAEGADEEASLEDINVDDADESQELIHDDLLEDDATDEPEPPPAEKPSEKESAAQDSGREADELAVANAADTSDSDVEEIWLGEVTLESAEKDELEFDVPGDKVDSVFMAIDEEPPASETGAEAEDGSECESLEEFIDSPTEGAEEIVLASDDALDLTVTRTTPELAPTTVVAETRRFTLPKKYHRPAAIAVAVALALMLLVQLTHYFRYQILESGALGPLLDRVYSGLGIPLTRQWDLDAYDIRRTKVVGNETGTGVVEISAILANRASFAQPYPILRLIFTDQWDEALAIRDLSAGEYLQTDPGDQARMAAGEQVAVDIRVMELADNLAQNYRIEYCLQDSEQNLRCK